jgi:methionyl-tRNA formyltransferase
MGFETSAVITRCDRPAGRGLRLQPTAVKAFAEKEGLKVFQPDGPDDPAFMAALDDLRPELLLVADFGYLLPRAVLEYPPLGCVNVHPSLLPRYRGAAPIQRALMRGERATGVTLMALDEGMDTGGIIAQEEICIEDADDALSLRRKLVSLGARMVVKTLPSYAAGSIAPHPQEDKRATYADPIRKPDTIIDWTREAMSIHNQVRALSPLPGAYTKLRGKRLKILRTVPREDIAVAAMGKIALCEKDLLMVGTGKGALQVEEIQPEGKKTMSTVEFLRGYRPREGEDLGEVPRH